MPHMIVSREQAELAAKLQASGSSFVDHDEPAVSPDVLRRALALAASTPELRPDRVREARDRMDAGVLDSGELAEKMICRMVCDSLR